MKYLKLLLGFIVTVSLIVLALSFLMPLHQSVDRSVVIQAPASVVFEKIESLRAFNSFSVWSRSDSLAAYTYTGTDGAVGSAASWTGDPYLAGNGRMELTAAEPGKSVSIALHFTEPKKQEARSVFTLSENNGATTVSWHFEISTPRPWNIFNLFGSLDKQMGHDFETSLNTLRDQITGGKEATEMVVKEVEVPAATYLCVKQEIQKADVGTFCAKHYPLLKQEIIQKNWPLGIFTGIIYEWDPAKSVTQYAAALPVPAGTKNTNPVMEIAELPSGKVLELTYFGSYSKSADAYAAIDKYIADKKLKRAYPVTETYTSGPLNETDPLKWGTTIRVRVE